MEEKRISNPCEVTIMIPCFNMEKKIHRLLDSLLSQTRRTFKVIVVDDGSKDNSKAVIEQYAKRFETDGLSFQYVYQDNAGAASAINNALKLVDTEFFCLPDADDYYDNTYIEECVSFLKYNINCGIVFTECRVFKEENMKNPVMFFKRADGFKGSRKELFRDFYWDRNVWFCPQYMIRTETFVKANNGMEIAGGKHGQNYQMILPVVYHSDFGYINKPIYNYIIYKNSDSHGKRTIEQRFIHFDGGAELLNDVFRRIGLTGEELLFYQKEVEQKVAIQKACVACEYDEKGLFEKYYRQIDKSYMPLKLERIYNRRNWPLAFALESYGIRLRRQIGSSTIAFRIKSLMSK